MTFLEPSLTSVQNIRIEESSKILKPGQVTSEKLWLGHNLFLYVHYDPDLGDKTLGQCHDKPLGVGQKLYEVSSKSKLSVKSYGLDTKFGYVCPVTLYILV